MKARSFLLKVALVISIVVSCDPTKESINNESKIVVFNLKHYSRAEISKYIEAVDNHTPKIIGVEPIFEGLKDSRNDSLLANRIIKCGKVILCMEVDSKTGKLNRSHSMFSGVAWDEGVLSFIENDNKVIECVPLFQNDDEQAENFAYVIAFKYGVTFETKIEKAEVNKIVEINYTKKLSDFQILDENKLDDSSIKDKIVLFGPLETSSDSSRMVKITNTILYVLNSYNK